MDGAVERTTKTRDMARTLAIPRTTAGTPDRRCTVALRLAEPPPLELGDDPVHQHIEALRWHSKHGKPFWPKMECVYFIRAGDFVKIGYTNNLTARVCDLQGANPEPLRVLAQVRGDRSLEREYHRRFASARHFLEWFRWTPEIQAEIDRLNMTSRESV